MAYSLITTPDNSWNILSSDYNTTITSSLSSEFLDPAFLDKSNFTPTDRPDCVSPKNNLPGNPTNFCNPIIRGLDADYVLIYLAGERFFLDGMNIPIYTLEGGGDESKKTWYAKISNHQVSKFIEDDNITPTKYYMQKSTLGMLTPFSIFKYVEPNTGRTFDKYQSGLIPVYVNDLKFRDPDNDPFYLVYASPSFYNKEPGIMSTVLIYKINHDYNPQN